MCEVDGYINNPYYANNIAYTINNNISPTANTIQLAIDGLTSKVTTYYANTNAGAMYIRDNNALGGEWASALYNSSGTLLFDPRNNAGLGTGTYYLFTQSWGSSGSSNFNTYLNGGNLRTLTISGTYTGIPSDPAGFCPGRNSVPAS